MPSSYSTYEAKAKFSEIMRKVRSGQSVLISYRGTEVAEIKPLIKEEDEDAIIRRLEEDGIISRAPDANRVFEPIGRRPGALERFLEGRE